MSFCLSFYIPYSLLPCFLNVNLFSVDFLCFCTYKCRKYNFALCFQQILLPRMLRKLYCIRKINMTKKEIHVSRLLCVFARKVICFSNRYRKWKCLGFFHARGWFHASCKLCFFGIFLISPQPNWSGGCIWIKSPFISNISAVEIVN